MNYLINFIFLFFFSNSIISQTLDAKVFSSSGEFFSSEKSLSSTLGENIVYDYSQENFTLHQGFQSIAIDLTCSYECVLFNQIIDLPEGWSYWSTYLSPKESLMENIFSQINEDVIILKDQYGEVYWPYFGINGINNHTEGEGYQIKMNSTQFLEIEGYKQINPTVLINEDWNILGCLYHEPTLIEESFAPIVENIILVKDENANVFWPYLSINTIDYFNPGEAYAVKSDSDINFTFENEIDVNSRFLLVHEVQDFNHFKKPRKTNQNMTVGFSYESLNNFMNYGDEIAAFDTNNNLVGRQIFKKDNLALTIWGDDFSTSHKDGMVSLEPLSFRVWNKNQDKELELEVLNWNEGNDFYTTNGINIAGDIILNNYSNSFTFFSVFPNPLISQGEIEFEMLDDCLISIDIVNNLGMRESLLNDELSKGYHSLKFSINKNPGIYHLVIEKCNHSFSIPLTVIK